MDDFAIRQRTAAANVIDLAFAAFPEHGQDRAAVVIDIEPVAHLHAVAINRQRLVFERIRDHQRDQLFRELIGTVIIRGARDHNRALEVVKYESASRSEPAFDAEYGLLGFNG